MSAAPAFFFTLEDSDLWELSNIEDHEFMMEIAG